MSKSINIIKLFTIDGPIHIDSNQLNSNRRLLTIYTAEGDKMSYVAPTEKERENASYGVHRDNLFATRNWQRRTATASGAGFTATDTRQR